MKTENQKTPEKMTTEKLAALICGKLPALSLPAHEIPTAAEASAWIRAAFRDTPRGATFRRTWPRGGDPAAETFWRCMRWEFSGGNLGALYAAQWSAPAGVFAKATTLATVCAVLSGRPTASDRWRSALGGAA